MVEPLFEDYAISIQLSSLIRSPFASAILFVFYAGVLWRLMRGRWRKANKVFKVLILFLPIILILLFPAVLTGESPLTKYGLWLDSDTGEVVFKTLGGEVSVPLCQSIIELKGFSDVRKDIGLRLFGISDPVANYHIGIYTYRGDMKAFLLVVGADEVVYIEHNASAIVLGAGDVQEIYNKLIEAQTRICG